jgi:hypothetical protein
MPDPACCTRRAITRRSVVGEGHKQVAKLRAVGGGAGDFLAEHLSAARRPLLGKLAGEILRVGQDAGAAVNHAPMERNLRTKSIIFQPLGFVPYVLTFGMAKPRLTDGGVLSL